MKHKATAIFALVMVLVLTASCAAPPQHSSEDQPSSDPQVSTSPSETTENPSAPSNTSLSIDDYNIACVYSADGKHFTGTYPIDKKYTLEINAVVNVSNVERVGLYEYIQHPITDSERDSLLATYHGDRIDQVYHHTVGNSNSWILENDKEFIRFAYSRGMNMIVEDTFFIRDQYVLIDEYDGYMLDSIDAAGMKISLEDAFFMCETLVQSLTDTSYIADNVRPFRQNQETENGMLWIVYRQVVDGMPITADNDLKFYVLDSGVTHLHGALYDLKPVNLDSKIISVEEAVRFLENNASLVNEPNNFMGFEFIYNDVIPVTLITFEYIVVRDENYQYTVVPVWRFLIGDDEESRLMYKDRIISINAITGELIVERRRWTY